jgi:hypothetical protein
MIQSMDDSIQLKQWRYCFYDFIFWFLETQFFSEKRFDKLYLPHLSLLKTSSLNALNAIEKRNVTVRRSSFFRLIRIFCLHLLLFSLNHHSLWLMGGTYGWKALSFSLHNHDFYTYSNHYTIYLLINYQ